MPFLYTVLRDAIRAVPAVKYALGVLGIVAAIALAGIFVTDYRVVVLGVGITLGFMVLLVVFASFARKAPPWLEIPARVLVWAVLLLSIVTAVLVLSSIFFGKPLPLQEWVVGAGQPTKIDPDYINVGTDTDKQLEQLVKEVAQARNVTIRFNDNCPQTVRSSVIEAGDHEGDNLRAFLENLKQRVKGPDLKYVVYLRGERRYEISCE